jgi:hypothetical protein
MKKKHDPKAGLLTASIRKRNQLQTLLLMLYNLEAILLQQLAIAQIPWFKINHKISQKVSISVQQVVTSRYVMGCFDISGGAMKPKTTIFLLDFK